MPADPPEADPPEGQNHPSRSERRRPPREKGVSAGGDDRPDVVAEAASDMQRIIQTFAKASEQSIQRMIQEATLVGKRPDVVAEASDEAQQSMFRDIDVILARLENGIAAERTAMDALLDRLISKAA